jgi:hypothetical protein
MKRQLLFVALLVIGFNASAQFTKGEKVLGANLLFNTSKTVNNNGSSVQENSNATFLLNTGIGWVKSEKRISGFRVAYYNTLQKNNNGADKTTSNGISAGVFNQHIKTFNKSFFGFLETNLNGGYVWGKYSNSNSTTGGFSTKGYNFNTNANIGIGYRITKHLIADATLTNLLAINYSHNGPETSTPIKQSSKTSNFSISTGLSSLSLNSVAIGFRWVFQ